uniref:Aggrecan core protein-like n=1 Tax=Crassostrea virginica TaxID=6565 RepID=A0A8B8C8J7_CRAVI|nr:aggrecan core protein-like [Crassostrea virginica]
MIIRNFNTAIFVTLAITKWTQGQDSGAVVSALMKKHASFDGNLPRTSACYISEIDNTSPLQCASQCLTRPDVCQGILFNRDSKACKLIKCNPAFVFTDGQFDTGKWELHWKENGDCEPGWLKHEQHCYFINNTGDTWMNSKTMCEDNGGSLASIRSSEENSWIVDTFLPPWNSALCTNYRWMCCGYWVGGNDRDVEGTFVWTSDNSSLGFVNWHSSEPNNLDSNEDCLSLCPDKQWNDRR